MKRILIFLVLLVCKPCIQLKRKLIRDKYFVGQFKPSPISPNNPLCRNKSPRFHYLRDNHGLPEQSLDRTCRSDCHGSDDAFPINGFNAKCCHNLIFLAGDGKALRDQVVEGISSLHSVTGLIVCRALGSSNRKGISFCIP